MRLWEVLEEEPGLEEELVEELEEEVVLKDEMRSYD